MIKLTFGASLVLLCLCDTGFARGAPNCAQVYKGCLRTKTPEQCQTLLDSAYRENGTWGSPDARKASKTTGEASYCRPW